MAEAKYCWRGSSGGPRSEAAGAATDAMIGHQNWSGPPSCSYMFNWAAARDTGSCRVTAAVHYRGTMWCKLLAQGSSWQGHWWAPGACHMLDCRRSRSARGVHARRGKATLLECAQCWGHRLRGHCQGGLARRALAGVAEATSFGRAAPQCSLTPGTAVWRARKDSTAPKSCGREPGSRGRRMPPCHRARKRPCCRLRREYARPARLPNPALCSDCGENSHAAARAPHLRGCIQLDAGGQRIRGCNVCVRVRPGSRTASKSPALVPRCLRSGLAMCMLGGAALLLTCTGISGPSGKRRTPRATTLAHDPNK